MNLLHFQWVWESDLFWNQLFQVIAAVVNLVFWGLKLARRDEDRRGWDILLFAVLTFGLPILSLSPLALWGLIAAVLALASIARWGLP